MTDPLHAVPVVVNALHDIHVLFGWSLFNPNGTTDGQYRLRAGGADGPVLAEITIPAKTASTFAFANRDGVSAPGGVYVEKVGSATCQGCLFRGGI